MNTPSRRRGAPSSAYLAYVTAVNLPRRVRSRARSSIWSTSLRYRLLRTGEITLRTQRITSSLSAGFRGGVRAGSLILDAKNIILVSHGAIHASAKGDASECGLSTTGASDEHGGRSRHAVARGSDLTAARISLSRSGGATGATRCGCRADAAHHLQNSWQRDSRTAYLCRDPRSDIERGGDTRHHTVCEACPSPCLGGVFRQMFVLSTPSIVCSLPSSSKSTRSAFPIVCV